MVIVARKIKPLTETEISIKGYPEERSISCDENRPLPIFQVDLVAD